MNKSHTKEGQDIINGNLQNLTTRLCFKKKNWLSTRLWTYLFLISFHDYLIFAIFRDLYGFLDLVSI